MYVPKLEKDIRCPLEYGLSILNGKWNTRIIGMLAKQDSLRYSVIRDNLEGVTDSVLAAALKELVENDMIERQQFDEIPLRVEYSLTEKGFSLIPIMQSICRWSTQYHTMDTKNTCPLPQCQNCVYYL